MFNLDAVNQTESLKLLINMLDNCETVGIYAVNKQQQVIYWNQQMEYLTGLTAEDTVNQTVIEDLSINQPLKLDLPVFNFFTT